MLRLTAILVVATLTGLPVVPAACLTWCGEQQTTRGYCHDEAAKNGAPIITTASASCGSVVTEGAFIREEGRPVLRAVQNLVALKIPGLIAAAPGFAAARSATDAPRQAPRVLRI